MLNHQNPYVYIHRKNTQHVFCEMPCELTNVFTKGRRTRRVKKACEEKRVNQKELVKQIFLTPLETRF